jgi:protease II
MISNNEIYVVSLIDDALQPKLVIENQEDWFYTTDHSGDYIYARINDKGNNFRIIRTKLQKYIQREERVIGKNLSLIIKITIYRVFLFQKVI